MIPEWLVDLFFKIRITFICLGLKYFMKNKVIKYIITIYLHTIYMSNMFTYIILLWYFLRAAIIIMIKVINNKTTEIWSHPLFLFFKPV